MEVIVAERQGGKSYAVIHNAVAGSMNKPVKVVAPTQEMAVRLKEVLLTMIVKAGNGYTLDDMKIIIHGHKSITFMSWTSFIHLKNDEKDHEAIIDDADLILNRLAPIPIKTISITGRKV